MDAHFDMNGVNGTISFYQESKNAKTVQIIVDLGGLEQFNGEFLGWHIHEWPINFALLEFGPCSDEEVGGHYDPLLVEDDPNYDGLCANDSSLCSVGDLAGRHGHLNSSSKEEICFDDPDLNLYLPHSIAGRSIVLHNEAGVRVACANLQYSDGSIVTTYRAPFPYDPLTHQNTLQGDIILKRIEGKAGMTLHAELYRVDGGPTVNATFEWSLRVGNPGEMGDCSDIRHVSEP